MGGAVQVQNAGSGLWIHGQLASGNGEHLADLDDALDTVVRTVERLAVDKDDVAVFADGEYNDVPSRHAARSRGLCLTSRVTRPELLRNPEVLDRLRQAIWYEVSDSRSGPRRTAADLGIMRIAAGKRTKTPAGDKYESIDVRVVASRFARPNDTQAQRGTLLDGFQVELFGTDLCSQRWPADEVVSHYYGRTAQENRFHQDDRELGTHRIVSYHLPGQELATLAALSVWNFRICAGFATNPPPPSPPTKTPRKAVRDLTTPAAWPLDPDVAEQLRALPWPELLKNKPDWRFDVEIARLFCSCGEPKALCSIRPKECSKGRTAIIFRQEHSSCVNCINKHFEFTVPTNIATRLRSRLAKQRAMQRLPLPKLQGPPPTTALETVPPLLLPAQARKAFYVLLAHVELQVTVKRPQRVPQHPMVAKSAADRQRRRLTWDENFQRNELPAGTDVRIIVAGSDWLCGLFGFGGGVAGCVAA